MVGAIEFSTNFLYFTNKSRLLKDVIFEKDYIFKPYYAKILLL